MNKFLYIMATIFIVSSLTAISYARDPEALINAAKKGDVLTVQDLLAKGANVDMRNEDGWTPLIAASFYGRLDTVQALLAKGADVNAKTNKGETALMEASVQNRLEVVQALLAKGADINAKSNNEMNALMLASREGHLDIVKTLLANGVDVNAETKYGKTALAWASLKGNKDIVILLIDAGAKRPYVGFSVGWFETIRLLWELLSYIPVIILTAGSTIALKRIRAWYTIMQFIGIAVYLLCLVILNYYFVIERYLIHLDYKAYIVISYIPVLSYFMFCVGFLFTAVHINRKYKNCT